CIRPSTDSLDSPTPSRCPTRRGPPLLRSWPEPRSGSQRTASPTSTGSSPTTGPATALETSPGSSDDARDIRRRSRTPRATTGKLSVTSESWPRNCSTPESSIASRPVIPRSPSGTSTTTTTARTAEPVGGRQHLDFGAASPTFSPHTASDQAWKPNRRAGHLIWLAYSAAWKDVHHARSLPPGVPRRRRASGPLPRGRHHHRADREGLRRSRDDAAQIDPPSRHRRRQPPRQESGG